MPESLIDLLMQICPDEHFAEVLTWIAVEQKIYAEDGKFDATVEMDRLSQLKDSKTLNNNFWLRLTNYFSRALILGLDTPGGKQALLKFASTAVAMCAYSHNLYGEFPLPGQPSGAFVPDELDPGDTDD